MNESPRLAGEGSIELSNGREFHYALSGKYNARTKSATVRLTGIGEAASSKLLIKLLGDDFMLVGLKGKLLGQTLSLK